MLSIQLAVWFSLLPDYRQIEWFIALVLALPLLAIVLHDQLSSQES